MKVLFIRSGNRGIYTISQNQGESLLNDGVEVLFYDVIGKGIKGYLSNITRLRRFIKLNKPDVLHAHYSLSGFVTALTFLRLPLVVSLMGSDVNASSKIQRGLINIFLLFFWKRVIVKSSEMRLNLGYKDAIIVPNGVNLENFYPMKKIQALDKIAWDKNKNHILFASDPRRPEKNYQLAEAAIKQLGTQRIKIHFLVNIAHDNMAYYYNAADCLVLTSNHEGSPNVIKEAMACNCPIVSTDVGDVKKVIGGTEGCFISSFDVNDVSEKISKAMNLNKRTNGREHVLHLDSKLTSKQIIGIYKSVLDK
ncbi:glycosyltransferase family 4 protein [Bacteroidota bacterium]